MQREVTAVVAVSGTESTLVDDGFGLCGAGCGVFFGLGYRQELVKDADESFELIDLLLQDLTRVLVLVEPGLMKLAAEVGGRRFSGCPGVAADVALGVQQLFVESTQNEAVLLLAESELLIRQLIRQLIAHGLAQCRVVCRAGV